MAAVTHVIQAAVNAHNGTSSGAGSVSVDGTLIASSGVRGHTVYILEKNTLALVSKNSYDTYQGYTSDQGLPSMGALLAQLNSIATDNFVVITTADAITNDEAFRAALTRFGLPPDADILCTATRRAFAFIGQLGLASGKAGYKLGGDNQSFAVDFTVGYGTVNPPAEEAAATLKINGADYLLAAAKPAGAVLTVKKGASVFYKKIGESGSVRVRAASTAGFLAQT